MVKVTKEVFFDMLNKKVMSQDFKQWQITSRHKKSRRKKRWVSDDVYETYQKLISKEN